MDFFDFNKTPIAPIGIKSLVYNDPAVRTSWALHGTDAFYVGTAPKHYWCLCSYMPTTHCCCVADTWQQYPSHCMILTMSAADLTVLAACNVLRTLKSTIPSATIKATDHSTAIWMLHAIVNLTLSPIATAPRLGAALELRRRPATITPLLDRRVLRSTISNSPAPALLYPHNATTSIDATSHACI